MKRSLLVLAALALMLAIGVSHPVGAVGPDAIQDLPGCAANSLPANDDESTELVGIGFEINFFGSPYSSLYVNNNGNLTFLGALSTFTPFPIAATGTPIIAPFFGDVDTRGVGSGIVTYGQTTVGSQPAFCAMWDDVGVGYYGGRVDKLNMFQVLLVSRSDIGAGDFDIVFNYDQIQWETGQASGGTDGLGGSSARVGYSNGDTSVVTSSFELPGSAINGALLDSNPATGLVHNSRGSLHLGRYIFEIRNGAAPAGGSISGTVTDTAAVPNPVPGALVQVCRDDFSQCVATTTNAAGGYQASGLADGAYRARAFPPAGSDLIPTEIVSLNLVGGGPIIGADIAMPGPTPPPPGTAISPSHGSSGGVPVVFWGNELTLTTTGCPGGIAEWHIHGSGFDLSGPMVEDPAGSYTGTVPPLFPNHGTATVHMHIVCPDASLEDIEFPIYIDPSGTVVTTTGTPIVGATVTLYRSDTGSPGSFVVVPDGSAIMSPSNRTNPDLTNAAGEFAWDVIAGFYVVRAEFAGCWAPGNPAQLFVETTPSLTIPPPALGLELVLECPDTTPPVLNVADVVAEATSAAGADVTYTATALDDVDGPIAPDCAPLSGSTFPIGVTTVTCTATDAGGNSATASFTVTVVDTKPLLSVPAPITVEATSAAGAAVTFSATAVDAVDGAVTPVCTPASGSTFAVGTTTVTCTATDTAGNSATGSFTVTVTALPATDIAALRAALAASGIGGGQEKSLDNKLEDAQKELDKGKTDKACKKLSDFVEKLLDDAGKPKVTTAQSRPLVALANEIMTSLGCAETSPAVALAEQQLLDLIDSIAGMSIDAGLSKDLQQKAGDAGKKLAQGKDACKDLDQIVKKATDEAGKKKPKLTAAQANAIALQVGVIKSGLGC